jgi:energy-coupling factor transport system ATP-binding protein
VTPSVLVKDVFRVHSTAEGEAAALQGLSLEVQPEELLVVYGPSGSGKTSLLRLLAGLDRPSSGLVRVFGAELARLSARALDRFRARTIGYLDQHYWRILSPELPIRELVGLRLALRAVPPRTWRRRADELLEVVGLHGRGDALPGELSGGEQQRVALCIAVSHRPRLLLADEPTGELDLRSAGPVYPLVGELARAIRCSAVVVTHDPRWSRVADRTVHIRDGRVSEERVGRVDPLLVVDEQGWLRLPQELRARAGIGDRAAARLAGRELVLRGFATPMEAARPSPRERPHGPGPVVAALSGVRKSYPGSLVLENLDAAFRRRTLHVVTGRSGSGKTTLLRLLIGLEDPDEGSVVLDGTDLGALDRAERARLRRQRVGYVSQQAVLVGQLTARENVELGIALRERQRGTAAAALDAVGLTRRADHRLARLSAGEIARVAIARAIAGKPALLVLDEPTARLDEANARLVAGLLGHLAHELSTAVACSTHDPAVIEYADDELPLDRPGDDEFAPLPGSNS